MMRNEITEEVKIAGFIGPLENSEDFLRAPYINEPLWPVYQLAKKAS